MNTYFATFKKYVVFSGRANRKEYWTFFLINLAIVFALTVLENAITGTEQAAVAGLFSLIVLLPAIAVSVRRLHDINKTGWWYLFILVPFVGPIVLIVFFLWQGDKDANDYGEPPSI